MKKFLKISSFTHISLTLLFSFMYLIGCTSTDRITINKAITNQTIQFAQKQLIRSVDELGENIKYPRSTNEDGTWKTVQTKDWTSGFFPGCLWYMYELTDDQKFKNFAEQWTEGLTERQFLTTTHDIGFIIFNSYGNGYRLTLNESYKPIIIQAAKSLITRYNPKVGCILSWDNTKWQYPVIIDNLMNLELLFWASKNGGSKDMYDIAVQHALNTMENHFRSDGSTYHVVDYDTATGNVIARETHQGFDHESVWARGQAWAIYGFTMTYRETNEERFLEIAEKAANWFINHLPNDYIPYWDFYAPKIPNELRDASSAAIASSALFELSKFTKNSDAKIRYEEAATNILLTLCSNNYLEKESNLRGIIKHAVGNYPKNSEMDVSLIYADYYFLEALVRYKKLQEHSQ